jgi:2-keto-4-pentenoate hydratase
MGKSRALGGDHRLRRIAILAATALAIPLATAQAACPEDAEVARMAADILASRPAQGYGSSLTMEDAACAREKLVALLVKQHGAPVGYKVGLTNAAAQQRFGVPSPVRGTVYQATIRARGTAGAPAEVPAAFAALPNVESDLLVRVRDEGINEAGSDHVAILRHLDQVIPFIEMPDLVLAPGQMNGPNLVAINVGARLGVLGEPIPVQATPDFAARLGSMTVILATEQKELSRAPGTALLGHPLNVIPWLVEDLKRDGRRLRAGDIVSLGGFSPALPTEAGRTVTATYEGLAERPLTVSVRTP